jgi:hypothetical protein
MTLRPQRRSRRDRDTVNEGRVSFAAKSEMVLSCSSHSQYQPPTGVNGKRRTEVGDDSRLGCVWSSGLISTTAGEEGTFMIGRLLLDGDENGGKRTQEKRAQDVHQSLLRIINESSPRLGAFISLSYSPISPER